MENIYKITYYSYDEECECYCEEFSRMVTSDEDEEQMRILMDLWNMDLMRQDINGRVAFSTIYISPLEDYSVYDLIRNISEL